VKTFVGTRGVCEPAALLASRATRLLVPKQKYTEEAAARSMTLAVAEIPYAPRSAEVTHG
jgi:cobalt-precorrin 5A hydrolase